MYICTQCCYGRAGLSILLHGAISLPDARRYLINICVCVLFLDLMCVCVCVCVCVWWGYSIEAMVI